MKKLSIYFFTTIFFISYYPIKCDWPYPEPAKPAASVQQQQIVNTPINEIEVV